MSFPVLPAATDILCVATAAACAVLLMRAWRRTRSRLLLWTAVSFVLLAINNLLLVLDMFVFRTVDLWLPRVVTFLAALLLLLYGFVWEAD